MRFCLNKLKASIYTDDEFKNTVNKLTRYEFRSILEEVSLLSACSIKFGSSIIMESTKIFIRKIRIKVALVSKINK